MSEKCKIPLISRNGLFYIKIMLGGCYKISDAAVRHKDDTSLMFFILFQLKRRYIKAN